MMDRSADDGIQTKANNCIWEGVYITGMPRRG